MPVLLTKLSNKYKCDKSDKNHKYTIRYHNYFEKDRHRKFNLLELGFGTGSSVKMWMEYFTKANLIVVDNMKELPKDPLIEKHLNSKRFKFVSSDQTDMHKMMNIFENGRGFYIIIDDASHIAEDQQYSFYHLFHFVELGGWYVIEDLKCKRNHNKNFSIQADKTLKVLNKYIETGKFNSKILTSKQNLDLNDLIESVKIYDKIAFIKKRG